MQNPNVPRNPAEIEPQGLIRIRSPWLPWTLSRFLLVGLLAAIYVIAFIPLYGMAGGMIAALAIFPTVAAGWLLGAPMGLIAGLLFGLVINIILYLGAGEPLATVLSQRLWMGSILITLVGGVAGWASELLARSRIASAWYEQQEEEMAKQKRYADALYNVTLGLVSHLDLKEVLENIVKRAGELIGTNHGYVYWREPGQTDYEMRVGVGDYRDFVGTHAEPGVGLTGRVIESGEPMVVEDYAAWGPRLPDPRRDVLHGVAGVPLKSGNEVVGVIGLAFTDRERKFTQDEVDLLNRFAQLASVALENAQSYGRAQQEIVERKRTEEELRRTERFLDSVVDNLPITLFAKDAQELRYVRWNRAAEELLGFSREEAVGKTDYDFYHNEEADSFTSQDREVVSSKKPLQIAEEKIETKNKGARYFHTDKIPILDNQGEVQYVLGISTDITEQRRTEEEMRRNNAYLTALHDTSMGLMQHRETAELLEDIILRVGRLLGTEHAYVYLQDPTTGEVEIKLGTGIYRALIGQKMGAGAGLATRVWKTGQPVAIDNYQDWPGRLMTLGRHRLRAVACVPLKSGDKVVGTIGLGHTDENLKFGPPEVQVLTEFADLATIALDNARLFEQTQEALEATRRAAEREAQVANINDRLHASTDVNAILRTAVEELRHVTGRPRTFVLLTGAASKEPEEKERAG